MSPKKTKTIGADLQAAIDEHVRAAQELQRDAACLSAAASAADAVASALAAGNRVLICGNGGSAADAQHIAAEFTGHFKVDRPPLAVQAITVNSSSLTAIGNDYGYEHVFSREVLAYGRKGDVLIALSTSGNSPNVLRAVEAARGLGMATIGMTGRKGGKLLPVVDVTIRVPSDETPRIQELHILLGHGLCQAVDNLLVKGKKSA